MKEGITLNEFFEGTMPTRSSKVFYEENVWYDEEILAKLVNCRCSTIFNEEEL